MSEERAEYTVVSNPTDEEIRRADVVEAGVDMFIASRARRAGASVANNRATYERAMFEKRQREERREHAAAWRRYHLHQIELHQRLANEHREKLSNLVGR